MGGDFRYTIGLRRRSEGSPVDTHGNEGAIMIRTRAIIGGMLMVLIAGSAWASGLGDPARPLIVSEWLKGGPIKLEDGKDKNVYVLEFWATTCPHSRASIPFLTEMQKKYADKDVIFIGISAEPAEKIKEYLLEIGDQLDYAVAADRGQATIRMYFGGVHNTEIPHAFVIDKTGTLVWHGHPMSGLDKTIAGVLDGTYDIDTGKRMERARNLKTLYLQLVRQPNKVQEADRIGPQIVEDGKDDILLMNDLAWKIATEPGLIKRDFVLALRAAKSAYDGCKGQNVEVVDTYAKVLFESGEKDEAVKYAREAVGLATDEERKADLQATLERYEAAAKQD